MNGPLILLIGMMGAGKSTVGRALAERTGWAYVDNDELLQQASGRSAPEILAEGGEASLRLAESAALDRALMVPPPAVVGVAGGAVLDARNRARLRAAPAVVWLRARPETLARRVGTGAGRAWLHPDPTVAIAGLAAAREPFYAQIADLIVDVDELSPAQVAELVMAAVP